MIWVAVTFKCIQLQKLFFFFVGHLNNTNKKHKHKPKKNTRNNFSTFEKMEADTLAIAKGAEEADTLAFVQRAIEFYEKHLEVGKKYSREHREAYRVNSKRYYKKLKTTNPEGYKAYLQKIRECYERRMADPEVKAAFLQRKREARAQKRQEKKDAMLRALLDSGSCFENNDLNIKKQK